MMMVARWQPSRVTDVAVRFSLTTSERDLNSENILVLTSDDKDLES